MKLRFQPIGKRIIKSSAGVLLCYAVYLLRAALLPKGWEGLPFYSMLAVLWCMQPYADKTLSMALQRTTGTIIGAMFGLVTILLEIYALPVYYTPAGFAITGLMIIPVLYTTVVLNKRNSSYFSCVVFLSITVNHLGDSDPFIFVINRLLDTFIGIALGVLVNSIRLPRRKVTDTLFTAELDDLLSPSAEEMTAYSKVELNRMIDEGLKFTVVTVRTPASLIKPLADIRLKLPVVVMNGAALYDIQQNTYLKAYIISGYTCEKIKKTVREHKMNCFTNALRGDRIMIYYDNLENEAEKSIYRDLKRSPYRCYVNLPAPDEDKIIYLMIVDLSEKISALCEELRNSETGASLKIVTYPSDDFPGYSYIKIYNKNADSKRMVEYLMSEYDIPKTLAISSSSNPNDISKSLKKGFEPLLFSK